jgi:acyl transferase domain-containing protein/acyl-CoA thioesterase FadM/NADP-dependent 3-hydroxy acid dehydrogenase YdfG/phosphopantetheinyl transferase
MSRSVTIKPAPTLSRDTSQSPIAVIGLACWYPGARNPRQLWENILARRREFRRLPKQRLSLDDYYHPDPHYPDMTYARQAAVIDGFDFNWQDRRIPYRTFCSTDTAHWLALDVALKAIGDAGFDRATIPHDRTGVIVGNTLTGEQTRSNTMRLRWPYMRRAFRAAIQTEDLSETVVGEIETRLESYYKSVFPAVNEDTLAGGLSNTLAGRICNYLDLYGGGYTVDGACSSSLLAVATAASGLMNGDLELAVAGGVDISLDPFELVGFAKTGALAQDEMRVYDQQGSGFIPGEGCGFVVLKRLEDARRDGNYVYAVIHGWGISSDGGGSGITAPNVNGQVRALRRAYARSPYTMQSLQFLEGHGTGTSVGDRVELEAIALAMGEASPSGNGPKRSCGITSLKSLIGHTKAAAGIGGLIKAVLAVNRRVLPPTAGCRNPHGAFDSHARSLYPILNGAMGQPNETIRAGVSAMGFGGINCHVTLESGDEPSPRLEPDIEERSLLASHQRTEIFLLTAGSLGDLDRKIRNLMELSEGISIAELADLAANLSNEVSQEAPIRAAVIADRPEKLIDRLDRMAASIENRPLADGELVHETDQWTWLGNRVKQTRVGLLFPGQGSQKLNMARILVERFPWARKLVEEADQWLQKMELGPIKDFIFRTPERAKDSKENRNWFRALSETEVAQPAICLSSALWWQFLQKLGITPVAVGGHSLGELTAFYTAGAYGIADLLRFAGLRGRAMKHSSANPGAMVSLMCSQDRLEAILNQVNGYAVLANINSPWQMVLSGEQSAIEKAITIAVQNDIQFQRLPVSNAFHSKLTERAARVLEIESPLPETLSNLNIRLFSGVNGQEVEPGLSLRKHFAGQVLSPVNFVSMIESMIPLCDVFIEVGPGRVLTGLVDDITGPEGPPCMPVESVPSRDADLNLLLARLFIQGVNINWQVLYEKRLVRPFEPPAELRFIENPCEQEFDLPDPAGDKACSLPVKSPARLLADIAQMPLDKMAAYLETRGPFLARVIAADLEYAAPGGLKEPDSQETPPEKIQRPDRQLAADTTDIAPRAATDDELESLLFSLVTEISGFTRDSLDLNMRLLDDLNLDSIKAGELVAKALIAIGQEGQIEPLDFANATLAQIHQKLVELKSSATPRTAKLENIDPLETVMEQAGYLTGLSGESLDAEALTKSDLGMDLDMLTMLLRRSATALHIETNVDPAPLLGKSLRQIAKILERLIKEQAQPQSLLGKLELDTWVRDFAVELIEEPIPPLPDYWHKRREDDWQYANVLILCGPDNTDVYLPLRDGLKKCGARVHIASFADARKKALVADITFSHLIAILPRTPGTFEANEAYLESVVMNLASLTPSPPAADAPRRRTTVIYLQFGGGYFGSQPRISDLNPCCATALAKSLHLERKDLRVRVLDFYPFLDAKQVAEIALQEINTPDAFAAVGFDRTLTRRVPRHRLIQSTAYKPRALTWTGDDVILVTGGAKGITAACAFGVARATGARMVLVGRSPYPKDLSDEAAASEITETLQKYAAAGLVAEYYSCDVCDLDSVASLIDRIRQEIGPVSGVIHGAGLNHPRPARQVSVPEALQEVRPKIMGALNLMYVLEDNPPKLFVGLSSIIGVTGMAGNAWYGFSNESLDVILRQFETLHPETQTLAVAFSIWRDEGMGARLGSVERLKQMGVDAIPTEEGVRRFVRLFLNDPGVQQVIVSARLSGLDTWYLDPFPLELIARYLEEPLSVTPGVESIFQTHLNPERDPYLKDHVFNGSYLFPTVFGLEAMAQVAAHATGIRDLSRVRIEDINLKRPIAVDPKEGADIVIWAQVQERKSDSDKLVVRSGITKLQSGVKADFFSATFVLGLTNEPPNYKIDIPDEPLNIRPIMDLYRPTLLFQGSRFQRIERIWELAAKGEIAERVTFSSRAEGLSKVSELAFPQDLNTNLLLGDPFMRDSLLQSAQLLVPQKTCLPVHIRSLDIYPADSEIPASILATARLDHAEERRIEDTVIAVDENSRVREKLEGYTLQVLKHHEDHPAASDLVSPNERDNQFVSKTLNRLCQTLKFKAPKIILKYLPGLHALSKEKRHALQLPIMREAARQALEDIPDPPNNYNIQWLESGKPVLNGMVEKDMDISLSHDDRLCICTVGTGPQGCDIAPVAQHSRKEWKALLGRDGDDILNTLQSENDSLDRAGIRVWAAREALRKADGDNLNPLRMTHIDGDAVIFQKSTSDIPISVITLPLELTLGPERILAVVVGHCQTLDTQVLSSGPSEDEDYSDLFNKGEYKLLQNGGPQNQLVFVQQIPVTFRPSAQLSRSVYFSNYIFWMGEVRETSAWPVLGKMARQFSTGKYGGVTNYSRVHILGEAYTGNRIEARIWASGNGGPMNSTMELTYDFRKMLDNGSYERVAWCELQTTWVRILANGDAKPEPYPNYYRRFLKNMLPRNNAPNSPEPLTESLAKLKDSEDNEEQFRAPSGPLFKPLLHEQLIETSLDNANLVGNIYFANYYAWMGQTRDRYFFNLIPDYFRGTGEKGELLCLECRVDHLREAMPFDRIAVTMSLKVLKTFSATFYFEYFRQEPDGTRIKLAVGEHLAVWVKRDDHGQPIPAPFPQAVLNDFQHVTAAN